MNLELATTVDPENPIVGDIKLTSDQITLVDSRAAISQHVKNRLLFFFGEWFLDQRLGFPYYQDVFIKNPNRPGILSAFRKTIRETPGIDTVLELSLAINADRSASLSFSAALDEGGDPLVFTGFVLGEF